MYIYDDEFSPGKTAAKYPKRTLKTSFESLETSLKFDHDKAYDSYTFTKIEVRTILMHEGNAKCRQSECKEGFITSMLYR